MKFSVKQINELLTGIVLAAELESGTPEQRKFLVMQSFQIDENGKIKPWNKKIRAVGDVENAVFDVRCYSLTAGDMDKYLNLGYDIDSSYLTEDILIKNIIGWDNLYKTLAEFTDDLSVLQPQWHCDNPLEVLE